MLLYLITNTVNGKQYVGITNGALQNRLNGHFQEVPRARVPLHLAMAKYGREAFRIEQLARASSREELCRLEREEIARRGCLAPAGYNLTPGGDGQSPGYVASEETRRKISERAKEAWARLSPEERMAKNAAISAAKKGRAPQHKSRRSLVGTTRDEDFKAKVSAGVKRYVSTLPEGEMARRARAKKT